MEFINAKTHKKINFMVDGNVSHRINLVEEWFSYDFEYTFGLAQFGPIISISGPLP